MKRALVREILIAFVSLALSSVAYPAHAESDEVKIAQQFGLQFLPVNVMISERLIEKHAAALGLGNIKVRLIQLSGGATVNDALLSGSIDIGGAGTTPMIKLWEKTRGAANVRALAPTSDAPMFLVTVDPKIKSLRDYTDKDKIALPSVKVSINAMVLQMAAEKLFGNGNHEKLDAYTVGVPHPDAAGMLRSRQSEVKSHFGILPYTLDELQIPGARLLLTSYDVLGGPHTVAVLYNTEKWKNDNPRTFKAVAAAMGEAMDFINKDKQRAAAIFVKETKSSMPVEKVYAILNRDDIFYSTTPKRVMVFADFMYRTGGIKMKPASWKDLFWENIHTTAGS